MALRLSTSRRRGHAVPLVTALGVGMLSAWIAVLVEAWPCLTALGSICGRSTSAWALSGHCPACPVALALTTAFTVAVLTPRGAPENALARV